MWQVATRLNRFGGVVSFDFRGHGRSGGLSTLGDREIKDLDVAVRYASELGYQRVAAVGFSMGASIVLRYAGLVGGVDAVVSVSGPGRWYYRGTAAHAPGALGRRAPGRPDVRAPVPGHQDQQRPVGPGAGAARRGRGARSRRPRC